MHYKDEEHIFFIGKLIAKEIQGFVLNEEEKELLNRWIEESVENDATYKRCYDNQLQNFAFTQLETIDNVDAFRRVKNQAHSSSKKIQKIKLFRLLKYSGAAIIVFALGILLYLQPAVNRQFDEVAVDYDPATYKASVVLSDGRTFDLKGRDTLVVNAQGVHDGQGNRLGEIKQASYATVVTPRGGLYNITLPDGTKVRLNAASSLQYPTHWDKDSREVVLQGEAYFEVVSKPQQPFIVHTSGQSVEVLGTHFNVSAHLNESIIKTTLLEGSVRVVDNKEAKHIMLQPGEQGVFNGQSLTKQHVDITQELAWLYGKFNFDGKNIQQVVDELSRWYDVDISFEGSIPDVEFFGGTFRDVKMSTILDVLKTYGVSHQMISERRLVLFSNHQEEKGGTVLRR